MAKERGLGSQWQAADVDERFPVPGPAYGEPGILAGSDPGAGMGIYGCCVHGPVRRQCCGLEVRAGQVPVGKGILDCRRIVNINACARHGIVRQSGAAGEQDQQDKAADGEIALNRDYHFFHIIGGIAADVKKQTTA